jgi:hypothetical protein
MGDSMGAETCRKEVRLLLLIDAAWRCTRGMSYVQVPAEAIIGRLESAGFRRLEQRGEEIVYGRAHNADASYVVKVYTSIRQGSSVARRCGQDAIRVVAVRGERGIFKGTRVHRTGTVDGVLDRMIERAREAYAFCSQHRSGFRRNAA